MNQKPFYIHKISEVALTMAVDPKMLLSVAYENASLRATVLMKDYQKFLPEENELYWSCEQEPGTFKFYLRVR